LKTEHPQLRLEKRDKRIVINSTYKGVQQEDIRKRNKMIAKTPVTTMAGIASITFSWT
jgi:hypothetical protein